MRYLREVRFRFSGDVRAARQRTGKARAALGGLLARSGDLPLLADTVRLSDGTIIRVLAFRGGVPIAEIFVPPEEGAVSRRRADLSFLKWLPEGFSLTPRSNISKRPWGIPDTGYGEVVPDGPLQDVLINQAPDNFYPDALFEAFQPNNNRVDGDIEIAVGFTIAPYAHLAYEVLTVAEAAEFLGVPLAGVPAYLRLGFSLPEIVRGLELKVDFWDAALIVAPQIAEEDGYARQIDTDYELLIRLPQSNEFDPQDPDANRWYAHRAEFVPFVTDLEEAQTLGLNKFIADPVRKDIFDYTNELRAAAGRKPLVPPLRGVYNGAAEAILREIVATGSYGHDSPEFREGYRFVYERLITFGAGSNPQYQEAARTVIPVGSENLLFDSDPQPATGDSLGTYLAKLWEGSPPHFAAMIRDYFDEDSDPSANTAGTLQMLVATATIDNISPSADPTGSVSGDLSESITATTAAQVFQAVGTAYQYGPRAWYGAGGRTLTFDAQPIHVPVPVLHRTARTAIQRIARRFDSPIFAVYHRGHPIILEHPTREPRPELTTDKGDIVAAAVVPEESKEGATLLAACLVDSEDYLIVRVAALFAPEAWAEQPQIIISDYAVNEPLYTDARLLTTTSELLPQETCGVAAEFSQSGRRCVASVHVREPTANSFLRFDEGDPFIAQNDYATAAFTAEAAPGVMYGTSITHREFDAITSLWTVFAKQELLVTAVDIRNFVSEQYDTAAEVLDQGNVYHVTCSGEYDAIAAYDGETIVYLRINVDYEQKQWGGYATQGQTTTYYGEYLFRDKVKLVFSDASEQWLRNFETRDRTADLTGTGFEAFQLPNTADQVVAPTSHDGKWQEVVGWDYHIMFVDPTDSAATLRRQVQIKGCTATQRSIFGDPDPTWDSAVLNDWDSPLNYWRVEQRVLRGESTEIVPWKTYHEFSAPEHVYEGGVYTQDSLGVFTSGEVIATTHSTRSDDTVQTGYPREGQVVFPNDPQFANHLACLFSPKPLQVISGRTLRDSDGVIVSQDSSMRAYGHYSFATASVAGPATANEHGVHPSVDKCAVTHNANISPMLASVAQPIAYTFRGGLQAEPVSCYELATTVYTGSYGVSPYLREPSEADPLPDGVVEAFAGDLSPVLQAQVFWYKDEWLAAGADYSTVNHRPFNEGENDDSRAFTESSLDIEATVNQGEISKRVTPIGVL